MDAEAFNVINRAVEAVNFDFAAVARAGVHLADVERAAQHGLDARLELPAHGGEGFGVRGRRWRLQQLLVRAVVVQPVPGRVPQTLAGAGGEFALRGHTDGRVHIGAQPAENTFAKVEPGGAVDDAALRLVAAFNGASGADSGGGAGVLPVGPVNLRLTARPAGHLRRRLRVVRRDDAGLQTLTKSFKHGQRSVPE